MKNQMLRIFVAGLLGFLTLPTEAQEPQVRRQVLYFTLEVAQGRNQYVSATLKVVAEDDAGFFAASGSHTGDYIQIRGKSYVIGRTNGGTITLKEKDAPGRFLSCCRQDGLQLVLRGTPAASEQFLFQTLTEKAMKMALGRKAAAGNTGNFSADSAHEDNDREMVLDDGAGK